MWKEHTGWACKEAIFTVWWGIHSPCWKWYKLRCTTWLHNQDNIPCKTELLGEFDKTWYVLNKLWSKLKDTKPKSKHYNEVLDENPGGVFDWLSKYSRVNIDCPVNLSYNQPAWKTLFKTYKKMELVFLLRPWHIIPSVHSPDNWWQWIVLWKVRDQVRMSLDDLSKFGIWYIPCFNIFREAIFCLFV